MTHDQQITQEVERQQADRDRRAIRAQCPAITEYDWQMLVWTVKGGATPLKRIISTMRHLGCKLGSDQVAQLIAQRLKSGELRADPHPLHEDQFFYSLPASAVEAEVVEAEALAVDASVVGDLVE